MDQKTTEEEWRALLTGTHGGMLALRRRFGRLPSPPRCKLCYAPFHGIGGALLKPWFGPTGLDRRTVEVRGREATLDMYALRPVSEPS